MEKMSLKDKLVNQWRSMQLNRYEGDIRALGRAYADTLRNAPQIHQDEKTGKFYLDVSFKEGTSPDLSQLPAKIGPWEVRPAFRKPFMNFQQLRDLFNAEAAQVAAVEKHFANELQGVSLNCDYATSQPTVTFCFVEGTTPDLTKLPAQIGNLAVAHEFRPRARLL
jgi:hypothetical protein